MSSYWQKMSRRERVLAQTTGLVVAICLVVFSLNRAVARIAALDNQANQLAEQLLNLHEQDARSQSIEDAFAEVEAQHSSAWTEQEIHDRLRTEIDRLALRNPYPEGGRAVTTGAGRGDYLVYVPTLRQGSLKEEGEGYREYQLTLRVEPAPLDSIVTFLSRLQQSNQSLWIDRLELARNPDSTLLGSSIDVTRTVVAGAESEEEYLDDIPLTGRLRNPSLEFWRLNEKRFPAWEGEGAVLGADDTWVTNGKRALEARAEAADARVYQLVDVYAGQDYEVLADIAAQSPGKLTAAIEGREDSVPAGQELIADGKMYRYRMAFRVPGAEGELVRMKLPLLVVDEAGGVVYMDNVRLRSLAP